MIFPVVKRTNTKIQIHKYTNTQIQHMAKCQKDPTCGICCSLTWSSLPRDFAPPFPFLPILAEFLRRLLLILGFAPSAPPCKISNSENVQNKARFAKLVGPGLWLAPLPHSPHSAYRRQILPPQILLRRFLCIIIFFHFFPVQHFTGKHFFIKKTNVYT